MTEERSSLTLITPARLDPDRFAPEFERALSGVGVAAVILDLADPAEDHWRRCAEILCPMAQNAGAAFLLRDRIALARAVGADGVHITEGAGTLTQAVRALRPDFVVGAGDCTTRHAAMTLGEIGPDYVLLGRLGEEDLGASPTLVEWWAELFEIPCIAMATGGWEQAEAAAAAGADFLALRDLVWDHPEGAVAALRHTQAIIGHRGEAVA